MSKSIEGASQGAPGRLRPLCLVFSVLISSFYLALYLPLVDMNLSSLTIRRMPWLSTTLPVSGTGFAVVDAIYVISLPSRLDRREGMDVLARQLDLHWTYVDGVSANDSTVTATLGWVNETRARREHSTGYGKYDLAEGGKFWPSDIDILALTVEPLDSWNSIGDPRLDTADDAPLETSINAPMPVATGNDAVALDVSGLPEWMILTPSRIACWQSHLNVITRIANDMESKASLVLEDDVDMEQDIDSQLTHLWRYLPADWDIVFLGHCWSNESTYPALSLPSPAHTHLYALGDSGSSPLDPHIHSSNTSHRLHPSWGPKCTHAYALSHMGARRLLLHLRYPPFAFSRAIDQALAWLVRSGRLRSFSVVPSIVVQRKVLTSDIKNSPYSVAPEDSTGDLVGSGSIWKDELTNGVFGGPIAVDS